MSIVLGKIKIPQHTWKYVYLNFYWNTSVLRPAPHPGNHHHYSWNWSVNEVTPLNSHICIWKTSLRSNSMNFLNWPKLAHLLKNQLYLFKMTLQRIVFFFSFWIFPFTSLPSASPLLQMFWTLSGLLHMFLVIIAKLNDSNAAMEEGSNFCVQSRGFPSQQPNNIR